jgi:hypothetical protein
VSSNAQQRVYLRAGLVPNPIAIDYELKWEYFKKADRTRFTCADRR